MDMLVPERTTLTHLPRLAAGIWYLKGFADAYDARWAVAPNGPAGEEYKKGYALGMAHVRDEFFAALNRIGCRQAVPEEALCSQLDNAS